MNPKEFEESQLMWKTILPPKAKDRENEKWSIKREGPFKVHKALKRNTYWLADL